MATQHAEQSKQVRRRNPQPWETRRLKSCVSDIVDLTEHKSSGEIYVALENVESWTGRIIDPVGEVNFESQVKRFEAGDVLFGKLRPYLAKVARPQRNGVCVGEFLVLRAHDGAMEPRYLESLMRSKHVIDEVNASTFGAKMPRADWHFIGNMSHAIPPPDEQATIVRYLDHADERINHYISAKKRLIALLEEQRQAVIHQAVTRGLNSQVRSKPSDIEWTGDVPEHWEPRALKTICRMKSGDGITAESIEEYGNFPVYGGNGIRGYTQSFTHDGEFVLIGRQGALCGNVHVARGRFWASEHAVVASLAPNYDLNWFAGLLTSMNLNQYSIAAAQPGLSVERVMNLRVPVPPSAEQTAIGEYIAKTVGDADIAAAKALRQIDLMNEYRTRLIADAVTGQIDVRRAVLDLPD